jgi:hypothetical protein
MMDNIVALVKSSRKFGMERKTGGKERVGNYEI